MALVRVVVEGYFVAEYFPVFRIVGVWESEYRSGS